MSKDDIRETRFVTDELGDLPDGAVRLQVERFAVTSNVLTYAAMGDAMGYWGFYPAASPGWGRVPAWGDGVVASSEVPELRPGDRLYGLLPMAGLVDLTLRAGSSGRLHETSAHRSGLPGFYNTYTVVAEEDADARSRHMLLQPLFGTASLLAQRLRRESGDHTVVFSSASSRTALGTARLLAGHVETVGLTSPRNVPFLEQLGVYGTVARYDDVQQALPARPSVLVDIAGSASVRARVDQVLGPALSHVVLVGASHWDEPAAELGHEVAAPMTFFFAPDEAQHAGAVASAQEDFGLLLQWSREWLDVSSGSGPEAVESVYRRHLDGDVDPAVGHVVSMT